MGIKKIINNNTSFNKLLYFGLLPSLSILGKNIKEKNPMKIAAIIAIVHIHSDYKYKTWPFKPYHLITKKYPIWTSYSAIPLSTLLVRSGKKGCNKNNKLCGLTLIGMGSIFGVAHIKQIIYRDNNFYNF